MSEQLDLFDQPISGEIHQLTFNQAMRIFLHVYWEKQKMHKSTGSFERYLISFFDGRPIETIGRQDVENMRNYMAIKYVLGTSAVNKCHMILTLLYNKLECWKEDGWAGGFNFSSLILPKRNPGMLVHKQKEPVGTRYITPWEFRKIYKLALGLSDIELADMVRFGIWSRMSPIDLFNLNDDEIIESRFQIEIRRRHTITKRNPQGCLQIVPLTEKMWGLINRRRQIRRDGEKRIFPVKNFRRRLKKLRRLAIGAGMEDFTLRDLRRSGSGYLYEKGISDEARADGMGHTSPRITKSNYTPPIKPHLKKQTQLLTEAF